MGGESHALGRSAGAERRDVNPDPGVQAQGSRTSKFIHSDVSAQKVGKGIHPHPPAAVGSSAHGPDPHDLPVNGTGWKAP